MLPNGWLKQSFGHIASFKNGLNFTKSDTGEVIKIVGVGDFKNHSVLSNIETLDSVQVAGSVSEAELLQSGDLLFVRSNGNKDLIGRCLYFPNVKERLAYSGFTIRGRVDNSQLLSEYASYLMRSSLVKKQFSQNGGGTNISNLSQQILNDIVFPLPPLPEQIKIAEILSTWDNAINTVQKLLANSQQQKKALMQQLLTGKKRFSGFEEEWEEKRFADLYWYQEGPGVRKHQFTEVGVKLFNGTNIQNSNIDLSKTTTHIASEEAYGTYAHFLVDEGDLVIACSGISVEKFDEKIAFVEKHHLPLCMNTSTMRFKTLNPQCSSIKFLRYFLSSKSFKSQIGKQATGSAQLNFGPSHVAKCKIELPNIDEQQKIAAVLTTADQEIDNLRDQLNHLKQEKKALMQQLLTGKRRVKFEEAA